MKTLVSDMGGVLYCFDPSFDPTKHQENFDEAMKSLGLENADSKSQLAGEWVAIGKGLLKIYPIKKGVDNLLSNLTKYQLIIVSTSLIKTSELILNKIGLKNKARKIVDMSDYGSKKDKEAWKRVFNQLENVDIIVEDSEKNLKAASQAAEELGFETKIYKDISLLF